MFDYGSNLLAGIGALLVSVCLVSGCALASDAPNKPQLELMEEYFAWKRQQPLE